MISVAYYRLYNSHSTVVPSVYVLCYSVLDTLHDFFDTHFESTSVCKFNIETIRGLLQSIYYKISLLFVLVLLSI